MSASGRPSSELNAVDPQLMTVESGLDNGQARSEVPREAEALGLSSDAWMLRAFDGERQGDRYRNYPQEDALGGGGDGTEVLRILNDLPLRASSPGKPGVAPTYWAVYVFLRVRTKRFPAPVTFAQVPLRTQTAGL
jgi:hypothetical protein